MPTRPPSPGSPDAPRLGLVRGLGAESLPVEPQSAGIRWMLRIGAVLVLIVWALEWHAGLINAWDRWLLPLLALAFLSLAFVQTRLPQHDRWVRLGGALTLNVYLALSIQMLLVTGGDNPDNYQFMTTLYWLPLAYGIAFVFLPVRYALAVSIGSFALSFLPMAIGALTGGAPTRWPEDFATLVMVLAAAQVAYIVLLRTVATMRADYLRARDRIHVVEALAGTDMLTGLPNRRAMSERLDQALASARRHGTPVVVALFDVDHFKRINDVHGHAAGDQALIAVGQLLSSQLRASDHLGRWGGEEFLLVASATPMHAGLELVERLRESVAAWEFDHGEPVTVSVGLSQCLAADDAHTLLQRADKALYRAKEGGRNRTESLSMAAAN